MRWKGGAGRTPLGACTHGERQRVLMSWSLSLEHLGAEARNGGASYAEALEAPDHTVRSGAVIVHGYTRAEVVAGQGSGDSAHELQRAPLTSL